MKTFNIDKAEFGIIELGEFVLSYGFSLIWKNCEYFGENKCKTVFRACFS